MYSVTLANNKIVYFICRKFRKVLREKVVDQMQPPDNTLMFFLLSIY